MMLVMLVLMIAVAVVVEALSSSQRLLHRSVSFVQSGRTKASASASASIRSSKYLFQMTAGDDDGDNSSNIGSQNLSLEEKMKSWEATEEERKAATLGGLIPQPMTSSSTAEVGGGDGSDDRSDAFDVGLYIAFPIMVLSGLFFALFPFIMGSIDVDSVGPPPTM